MLPSFCSILLKSNVYSLPKKQPLQASLASPHVTSTLYFSLGTCWNDRPVLMAVPLHCPFVRAFLQIPVSLRQMNGSADFSVRPSLETSIFLFPLLPFQPSFPTQTTGHLHRAHEAGLHDVPHYLLSKSLFHLPYSKSPSSRHLRTQVGRLGSKEPMVT